jgi:hypothetical protein
MHLTILFSPHGLALEQLDLLRLVFLPLLNWLEIFFLRLPPFSF